MFQRAAHLESTTVAPSPCSLRRPGWRTESRPPTLDRHTPQLLFARQSPQPRLPRQVCGRPSQTPRRGQAGISRSTCAPSGAAGIRRLAAPAVPVRLGGLFQATFRRGRTRAALSGLLHPSGGDFQSSTDFAGRGSRYFPLARLGPQKQEAADEPATGGVPAPLSAARAASGICAGCAQIPEAARAARAADEPATGGVPAPLSAARAASGICAHPPLRVIC